MKKTFRIGYLLLATIMSFICIATTGCSCNNGAKIPEYTVTVGATTGGSLVASANKVTEGETVEFTINVDNGYVLESFTINGSEVEVVNGSFTIYQAMRNYNAYAKFATPNVTLTFDSNGGLAVEDESRIRGDYYGQLPTPMQQGKRFVGWQIDGKGKYVKPETIVDKFGVINLVANWTDIGEEEKESLEPFSSTCVYHDMAATKYGVVWHTYAEPIYSAIQIKEGNTTDFTDARTIPADSSAWYTEYISNVVIDGLKFSTEYSVRFGDLSADVWSDTYYFTTREEEIDVAKFFFVADTQETYLIDAHPSSTYIGDTYFSYVVEDMTTKFPDADFIAHGGDIVNWGLEPLAWKEILQSLKGNLFQYPMQTASGNHEDAMWYSAGVVTTYKMFNIDYPEPEKQNPLGGGYFSYDYGPLHVTNLSTNDNFYNNGYLGENQLSWIERDFAQARENPEIKWIVVVMHEGIHSLSAVKAGSNYHRAQFSSQLSPLFDEYDVELVMYGHDHYLEVTHPLVCDENQTEVINLVSGISPATNQTQKVTLQSGEVIEEWVYPDGYTGKKGTVHFSIGPAGHQYGDDSTKGKYCFANLEMNKLNQPRHRMMLSGAKRTADGEDTTYSMYSYIEVSAGELLVRTYGVPVHWNATNPTAQRESKLLDGFRLTK